MSAPTDNGALPVPTYSVVRVPHAPSLEGGVNDAPWDSIAGVFLVDTVDGSGALAQTEVRACWTSKALHLLFVCVDSEVWSDYTRRDDPIYEQEVVELFIGSGEAPPSIYREFELSPFNVQWDGRIVSPTGDRKDMTADVAWDACSFDSAVRIARSESQQLPQCEGWSARLSIGFADLSDNAHTPAHGDVWRANFLRIEHRPHEQYLAWSPTLKSPADYHVPARFGRLILVG